MDQSTNRQAPDWMTSQSNTLRPLESLAALPQVRLGALAPLGVSQPTTSSASLIAMSTPTTAQAENNSEVKGRKKQKEVVEASQVNQEKSENRKDADTITSDEKDMEKRERKKSRKKKKSKSKSRSKERAAESFREGDDELDSAVIIDKGLSSQKATDRRNLNVGSGTIIDAVAVRNTTPLNLEHNETIGPSDRMEEATKKENSDNKKGSETLDNEAKPKVLDDTNRRGSMMAQLFDSGVESWESKSKVDSSPIDKPKVLDDTNRRGSMMAQLFDSGVESWESKSKVDSSPTDKPKVLDDTNRRGSMMAQLFDSGVESWESKSKTESSPTDKPMVSVVDKKKSMPAVQEIHLDNQEPSSDSVHVEESVSFSSLLPSVPSLDIAVIDLTDEWVSKTQQNILNCFNSNSTATCPQVSADSKQVVTWFVNCIEVSLISLHGDLPLLSRLINTAIFLASPTSLVTLSNQSKVLLKSVNFRTLLSKGIYHPLSELCSFTLSLLISKAWKQQQSKKKEKESSSSNGTKGSLSSDLRQNDGDGADSIWYSISCVLSIIDTIPATFFMLCQGKGGSTPEACEEALKRFRDVVNDAALHCKWFEFQSYRNELSSQQGHVFIDPKYFKKILRTPPSSVILSYGKQLGLYHLSSICSEGEGLGKGLKKAQSKSEGEESKDFEVSHRLLKSLVEVKVWDLVKLALTTELPSGWTMLKKQKNKDMLTSSSSSPYQICYKNQWTGEETLEFPLNAYFRNKIQTLLDKYGFSPSDMIPTFNQVHVPSSSSLSSAFNEWEEPMVLTIQESLLSLSLRNSDEQLFSKSQLYTLLSQQLPESLSQSLLNASHMFNNTARDIVSSSSVPSTMSRLTTPRDGMRVSRGDDKGNEEDREDQVSIGLGGRIRPKKKLLEVNINPNEKNTEILNGNEEGDIDEKENVRANLSSNELIRSINNNQLISSLNELINHSTKKIPKLLEEISDVCAFIEASLQLMQRISTTNLSLIESPHSVQLPSSQFSSDKDINNGVLSGVLFTFGTAMKSTIKSSFLPVSLAIKQIMEDESLSLTCYTSLIQMLHRCHSRVFTWTCYTSNALTSQLPVICNCKGLNDLLECMELLNKDLETFGNVLGFKPQLESSIIGASSELKKDRIADDTVDNDDEEEDVSKNPLTFSCLIADDLVTKKHFKDCRVSSKMRSHEQSALSGGMYQHLESLLINEWKQKLCLYSFKDAKTNSSRSQQPLKSGPILSKTSIACGSSNDDVEDWSNEKKPYMKDVRLSDRLTSWAASLRLFISTAISAKESLKSSSTSSSVAAAAGTAAVTKGIYKDQSDGSPLPLSSFHPNFLHQPNHRSSIYSIQEEDKQEQVLSRLVLSRALLSVAPELIYNYVSPEKVPSLSKIRSLQWKAEVLYIASVFLTVSTICSHSVTSLDENNSDLIHHTTHSKENEAIEMLQERELHDNVIHLTRVGQLLLQIVALLFSDEDEVIDIVKQLLLRDKQLVSEIIGEACHSRQKVECDLPILALEKELMRSCLNLSKETIKGRKRLVSEDGRSRLNQTVQPFDFTHDIASLPLPESMVEKTTNKDKESMLSAHYLHSLHCEIFMIDERKKSSFLNKEGERMYLSGVGAVALLKRLKVDKCAATTVAEVSVNQGDLQGDESSREEQVQTMQQFLTSVLVV